jgi:hypothetical protein
MANNVVSSEQDFRRRVMLSLVASVINTPRKLTV